MHEKYHPAAQQGGISDTIFFYCLFDRVYFGQDERAGTLFVLFLVFSILIILFFFF